MAKSKHKNKDAVIIIVIVLIIIAIIWWRLKTAASPTVTSNTIPTASGSAPPGGTVNVTFTNQPTTDGISTYIPLFGFLRFGSFFG